MSRSRMLDFEGETVTRDDKVQRVSMEIGIWSKMEIIGEEGLKK